MTSSLLTVSTTVNGQPLSASQSVEIQGQQVLGSVFGKTQRFGLAAHDYLGWLELPVGHAPFLNIKMATRGTPVDSPHLWPQIAHGDYDSYLKSLAQFARSQPRLWTFGHEPRFTQGTQAAYRSAWNHITEVLRGEGIGTSKIGTVLLASQYRDGSYIGWTPELVMDFSGVDGYGSTQFPFVADTLKRYLEVEGGQTKAIFETSFRNGTETQQKLYVDSVSALLKRDPTFLGCAFWEGVNGDIDTRLSGAGLDALQDMANDPFYGRAL